MRKIVIVPDLHGCYEELEQIIACYNPEQYEYIFLGDIVDRGASSYKTFTRVWGLINEHGASCVKSNHDNKFYRWLKKWRANPTKAFDTYGMTLAYGMQGTVEEFYTLDEHARQYYAEMFLEFYDDCPSFIQRGTHYFVHAGLWRSAMMPKFIEGTTITRKMRDRLEKDCIYRATQSVSELDERFHFPIILHVGHLANMDEPVVRTERSETHILVKHDIGLGKIPDIMFDPKTMIEMIEIEE